MQRPAIEKHCPTPALQEYVDFYVLLELPMSEIPFLYSPATNRNIMTLRFDDDMVMSFKGDKKITCQEVSLTGLSDGVYYVRSQAQLLKVVLIQFTPFGASTLFRIDQRLFLNSNESVEDFIPQSKKLDLKDRICSSKSSLEKIKHIDEFLLQFLPNDRVDFKLRTIKHCLEIMHIKPEITIMELCKSVKTSEVHLRRLFHQHVGVNPKRYLQLNRFNHVFLHIIEGKKIKRHAYYDDPHLIKEFRKFSGFSPSTYPKELISTEHVLESIPYF